MLKLDIEGAEIEVLTSLTEEDVLPQQICVEYDELLKPSKLGSGRVKLAHDHLIKLGYRAILKITKCEFMYVRKD